MMTDMPDLEQHIGTSRFRRRQVLAYTAGVMLALVGLGLLVLSWTAADAEEAGMAGVTAVLVGAGTCMTALTVRRGTDIDSAYALGYDVGYERGHAAGHDVALRSQAERS